MKKLMVPVLVLLICALVITGCSSASSTTSQPVATTTGIASTISTTPTTSAVTSKPVSTTSTTAAPSITQKTTSPTSTTSAKYGGTLKFIRSGAPGAPIGWIAESTGASTETTYLSQEWLLTEKLDGTLLPNLASSYEINDDTKNPSVTFVLRKGVKFHDGSDFNAQVVKWNFDQIKAGTMNRMVSDYWKSVDIIDDYTVKVTFTEWQNRVVRSFAGTATYIASKAAYDKNGLDYIRWHMVGTAPFMQTDFQRDVVTKTKRYDNYWQSGRPYLNGIEYLYVADEMTRLALFKSGGAEIMPCTARNATELKDSGYSIASKIDSLNALIPDSLNKSSPWSNPKVRMAAEYAIDKESISKTLGLGYLPAAYQLPNKVNNAYDPNIKPRTYDVAKAKQLMKEAGYPDGFRTRILSPTTGNRDIPVALQSYLGAIGIKVDLEFVETAGWSSITFGTWNNALVYGGVSDYANYNTSLNVFFSPSSAWYQSLKKPDGWVEALNTSMRAKEQDPVLLKKCINMFYEDATIIPLNHNTTMFATQPYVRDPGLLMTGTGFQWDTVNVWLNK